ncbi:MAG: hypothetical protein CVU07_08105 [Bacteroidetes bacterium HGW-Bacteroidetes-23]|nr:MAG: hypothetical protein CVU07_08105 [Bacteroidetes bacterium HGW-Bacteroidetes-23]
MLTNNSITMKNLIKIIFVLAVFLNLSFTSDDNKKITVIIDAGHGGHDHGSTSELVLEKELMKQISDKINVLNTNTEVTFLFTRTDDYFLSLKDRVEFITIHKPDLVISLHSNYTKNKTASGVEAFVSDKSVAFEKSNELALKLVDDIAQNTSMNNRGVKNAPILLLSKTNVPAITLEVGFLSNEEDRKFITSEEGQNKIAQTIIDFASRLK